MDTRLQASAVWCSHAPNKREYFKEFGFFLRTTLFSFLYSLFPCCSFHLHSDSFSLSSVLCSHRKARNRTIRTVETQRSPRLSEVCEIKITLFPTFLNSSSSSIWFLWEKSFKCLSVLLLKTIKNWLHCRELCPEDQHTFNMVFGVRWYPDQVISVPVQMFQCIDRTRCFQCQCQVTNLTFCYNVPWIHLWINESILSMVSVKDFRFFLIFIFTTEKLRLSIIDMGCWQILRCDQNVNWTVRRSSWFKVFCC